MSTQPISEQQLVANQANAQLSTGPKSEEGKRRASLNAVRHGLTGRAVVLPGEDLAYYQSFSKEMAASLEAEGALEVSIAQTIADCQWRLNRIRMIEDGMLALGHFEDAGDFHTTDPESHAVFTAARAFRDHSQAFVNLSMYEQRIHRMMERSMKQLQELQKERKAKRAAGMEEAIKLHKLALAEKQDWNPQDDGFVFSSSQVERESDRRDRLSDAQIAIQFNPLTRRSRPAAKKSPEEVAA